MTTSTSRPSSSRSATGPLHARIVRARWVSTDRSDGDFASSVDPDALAERCRSLVDAPWTLLNQVHGRRVVHVTEPGGHYGSEADGAVTDVVGAVLAVRTADCGAVVMIGHDDHGVPKAVGVAHAGWKGLEAGVLHDAVAALEQLGAELVQWYLAPCISASAYEFGQDDLDRLARRFGRSVVSVTDTGSPAFDLSAGVTAAMAECGAVPGGFIPGGAAHERVVHDSVISANTVGDAVAENATDPTTSGPLCTASDDRYYSWRARHESGRQVTAVWLEDEDRPVGGRAVERADGVTN